MFAKSRTRQNDFPLAQDSTLTSAAPTARGGKLGEAQDALLVLGYSRSEVQSALQTIDTASMEVEDIIRAALKKLMR